MRIHSNRQARVKAISSAQIRCLIVVTSVVSFATAAIADNIEFDIEGQATSETLLELAETAGIQIAFAADRASQSISPAISGSHSVERALDEALEGTGLNYQFANADFVVVMADRSFEVQPVVVQAAGSSNLTQLARLQMVMPAGGAVSETAPAGSTAEEVLEEIVVTGTRLRNIALTSNLITIEREDLEQRNIQTAAGALSLVLQNNSAIRASTPSDDQTTGIGFNNLNRSASADLRGLGAGSTLMLLNGSPIAASALAQGGANFSDIGSLPAGVIDRIEVFNDSASAVYGTSAIGGVVNIITRTNYDGLQLSASYNDNGDGGANQQTFLFGGASGDRWNILGSFTYQKNTATTLEDIGRTNRDYTALGGLDFRPSSLQPGLFTSFGFPLPGLGGTQATILPGSRSTLTLADLQPGIVPEDNVDAQFVSEGEGYSVFFHGGAKLGESVQLTFDVLASQRETTTDLGPESIGLMIFNGSPISPFPPGPLFASLQYVFENETAAGLLPRVDRESDTNSLAISTSLSGDLAATSNWEWNLNAAYSLDKATMDLFTFQTALRVGAEMGAINILGDGLNADSAQFTGLIPDAPRVNDSETSLTLVGGHIQGDLFTIPGGATVGLIGAEYRQDRAASVGSRVQGVGTNQDLLGTASRETTSVFAELAIPLVGEGNSKPGILGLLLTGSVRYAGFSDVGDTTVYRVGAAWQVVDWLKVTASQGKSFRAPSVFDLNEPLTGFLVPTPDFGCPQFLMGGPPCFGLTQNNFGGNDNLRSEEGESWAIGIRITPSEIQGLSFGANVHDIEFTNRITDPLGEFGLMFVTANTDLFPGVVVRDTAGNLLELNGVPINLARTESRAYDVFAEYDFSTTFGETSVTYDGTYQEQLDETALPGSQPLELAGTSYRGPKWRHRLSVQLTPAFLPNASVSVDINHLPRYEHNVGARGRDTSTGGNDIQRVDSFTTANLFASYRTDSRGDPFSSGWRVSVGISNLFDEDTPFLNSILGFDVLNGDPFGRTFSLTISKEL